MFLTIAVAVCWIITGVLVIYTTMLFSGRGVIALTGWSSMKPEEKEKYNKKKVYRREAGTMLKLTIPFVLFSGFMHSQLFFGNYGIVTYFVIGAFLVIEILIAVIASLRGYKGCEKRRTYISEADE